MRAHTTTELGIKLDRKSNRHETLSKITNFLAYPIDRTFFISLSQIGLDLIPKSRLKIIFETNLFFLHKPKTLRL